MIEKLYEHFVNSTGISTDSRTVKKGNLFISLSGPNFNGNQFAQQALEKGACLAVVDDASFAKNNSYFLVSDCLKALQELALHHRRKLKTEIIAITGSNGKTTTKELVHAVLSSHFKTICTQGNLNNHIGVPLTLLSITPETEYGIIEMGANKPGDIKELVDIAEPEYGIITNIGKAHLEGFGSFEGVIQTKSELYDFIQKQQGSLFLNADDAILVKQSKNLPVFTYGTARNANIRGQLNPTNGFLNFSWFDGDSENKIETHLVGDYNLPNALCAVAIGMYFGVPAEKINAAIQSYEPSNNRSQIVKTSKNTVLLDAYNANPSSMEAALTNFKKSSAEHKVVILGKMNELGSFSSEAHAAIQNLLEKIGVEFAYLVGDVYQNQNNQTVFKTTEELIVHLKQNPLTNKTLLIKGSRSNKLEQLLEYL